jgi:hypothetical protein
MPVIRTTISVVGLFYDEFADNIEDLSGEFAARPWLLKTDVRWDTERGRLVITIESEGDDLRIQGGDVGGVLDEVSDCVIATIHFEGERISFHVDEAKII